MATRIRKYHEKDKNRYINILMKTTGESKKSLSKKLDEKSMSNCWVAVMKNSPVGFVIFKKYSGGLYIDWLDVDPNYQRKGIGSMLIKKAFVVAKEEKRKIVILNVGVRNIASINLAIKNGFLISRLLKNHYGKNLDAFEMIFCVSKS